MLRIGRVVALWALVSTVASARAPDGADVQSRLDEDLAAGRPIVVHVVVALCDNETRGIVPVPASLGDGRDPEGNLYWGALYGVRTYLSRSPTWTRVRAAPAENENVLARAVFRAELQREGKPVPVFVVADAWHGAKMRAAITAYLTMAAGHAPRAISLAEGASLAAGGGAQLVAFVGHDGLMDFSIATPKLPAPDRPPRSAVVLACLSRQYFGPHLRQAGAHQLLPTTGLMAPEAHALEAAIRAWVRDGRTRVVVEQAAGAYDRYQKCGLEAARRLFRGEP